MLLLFCSILHNEHVNDLWWQLMLRVYSHLVKISNIPVSLKLLTANYSTHFSQLVYVLHHLRVYSSPSINGCPRVFRGNDTTRGTLEALVDWRCLSNSIKYKLRNFLTVDSATGCPSLFENIWAAAVVRWC